MRLVASAICRGDGDIMTRRYNGRTYLARSAHSSREEADGFADRFRGYGVLARVTQERRPRRVRTESRYMWIVWSEPTDIEVSPCDENGEIVCP